MSETIFCNWRSFKNDKNAFYFTLKALFGFKMFKLLLFLVMEKIGLISKIRLISNFVTSQLGQQTTAIYILINISRSKCNQIIKFGQLIEYKMRNIFLETSYTKCDGETIPRPFSKKAKASISLDQSSKVLYSLFLLYAKLRTSKIY